MSQYFVPLESCPPKTLFPGVVTRTLWLEKLMLSMVDLEPHAVVPMHQHPHEQMGMVVSGRLKFTIGGEERVVNAGEWYSIPGNVPHQAVALDEPARALDVFSPVREEYK